VILLKTFVLLTHVPASLIFRTKVVRTNVVQTKDVTAKMLIEQKL
jgi:hypothetical protein